MKVKLKKTETTIYLLKKKTELLLMFFKLKAKQKLFILLNLKLIDM